MKTTTSSTVKKTSALVCAALAAALVFSGCAGAVDAATAVIDRVEGTTQGTTQGDTYDGLLGTWEWPLGPDFTYVFEADGTGLRGTSFEAETFTWDASGSNLSINLDNPPAGNIALERWEFTIDGDTLTITSRQVDGMEFSYVRQGSAAATVSDALPVF
ncbi:MAG: hypothetical protein LBH13_10295 [Cellulomonadaceae bacterium]|jgi:hypothetical protein|nr:hypothetical protein [Cellulomonadaceae bacterium]